MKYKLLGLLVAGLLTLSASAQTKTFKNVYLPTGSSMQHYETETSVEFSATKIIIKNDSVDLVLTSTGKTQKKRAVVFEDQTGLRWNVMGVVVDATKKSGSYPTVDYKNTKVLQLTPYHVGTGPEMVFANDEFEVIDGELHAK